MGEGESAAAAGQAKPKSARPEEFTERRRLGAAVRPKPRRALAPPPQGKREGVQDHVEDRRGSDEEGAGR